MKYISRFLPVALALMLVFTGIDRKGSFDITAGSGTGKGGDVPVTPGLVSGGDYNVNAGGTSKGGEVPVVPGIVRTEEYTVNAGGTTKGGDVPVTPGLVAGGGGAVVVQD